MIGYCFFLFTTEATELPFIPDSTKEFKGVPYTDIIGEWFTLNGGEPVQGERNATLHKAGVRRYAPWWWQTTTSPRQTSC